MKVKPRVAVLMATYNPDINFLNEQIASIRAQVSVDVVLIIRDDKSTNSWRDDLATDLIFENTIVYDNEQNEGPSVTFFKLLLDIPCREMTFDYICFADQDDIWFPAKLEKSIRVIEANDLDFVSSSSIWVDQYKGTAGFYDNYSSDAVYRIFKSRNAGNGFVFNIRFLEFLKKFWKDQDENIKEFGHYDWLISALVEFGKFKSDNIKFPLTIYRIHGSNFIGANKDLISRISRLVMFFKQNFPKKYLYLFKVGISFDYFPKNPNSVFIIRKIFSRRYFVRSSVIVICLIVGRLLSKI